MSFRGQHNSIDVCVHARSQHRGIYDTHDTTTAPYTARPFDAVEGATALSATRFHFMWTCVSADSPSSAPLLSPYFPFFHCRGLDFVTGFEEPESALLPSSGSPWSSRFPRLKSSPSSAVRRRVARRYSIPVVREFFFHRSTFKTKLLKTLGSKR